MLHLQLLINKQNFTKWVEVITVRKKVKDLLNLLA